MKRKHGPRVLGLAFSWASCAGSLLPVCVCGESCDSCGRHVPQGLPAGLPARTAHPGLVHHLLFPRPGDADRGRWHSRALYQTPALRPSAPVAVHRSSAFSVTRVSALP